MTSSFGKSVKNRIYKYYKKYKRFSYVSAVVVQDPRAPRPYLFSDAQNVYDRAVLVCAVSVYIFASLARRPILRYQVQQVSKNLTNFTYSLRAHFYIYYT